MDENGNKKNNSKNTLIAVLLCCVMILQVVQIVQNNHISEELELQNGRIESVKDYIDSGILSFNNSAYYSIEELKQSLQKQNSIVEEVRIRKGALKEDNRTGEVYFYVVLKECEYDTQVKLQIDSDIFVSAKREAGNTFVGVYEADVFNDPGHDHIYGNCRLYVNIINGDDSVIEKIEEPYLMLKDLYERFLPDYYSMGGLLSVEANGKNHYSITVKNNIPSEINNVSLFVEKNGEVIKKVGVSHGASIETKVDLEATENDLFEMYLVGEDELGYVYKKSVVDKIKISSVAGWNDSDFPGVGKDGVYDKVGNQLV